MKIAVLNHIDGSVDILDTDIQPTFEFDWELWLSKQGYHLSSCSWMIDVKNLSFRDVKNQ